MEREFKEVNYLVYPQPKFTQNLSKLLPEFRVLIILGPEGPICEELLEEVKRAIIKKDFETMDYLVLEAEQLVENYKDKRELILEIGKLPFSSPKRVVVIKKAEKLEKTLFPYLRHYLPKIPFTTLLILLIHQKVKITFSKTDKVNMSGLFTTEVDTVLNKLALFIEIKMDYSKIIDWIIINFSHLGKNILPSEAEYLFSLVGEDFWALKNEISKIASFNEPKIKITRETIIKVVAHYFHGTVFELIDAISEGKVDKSLSVVATLWSQNPDPLAIISLLGGHFALLYKIKHLIQLGKKTDEIIKILNVHPYRFEKALKQEKAFSIDAIKKALNWTMRADRTLKTTRASAAKVIEILVISLAKLAFSKKSPQRIQQNYQALPKALHHNW